MATVPTRPLLARTWELRHPVSGYDAAYVAAAESHRCTLVTADARILRSGAACPIKLVDRPAEANWDDPAAAPRWPMMAT